MLKLIINDIEINVTKINNDMKILSQRRKVRKGIL